MGITAVFQKVFDTLRSVPAQDAPTDAVVPPSRLELLFMPPDPPATTKAQVDAFLLELSGQITSLNPAPVRSVLITGAMRGGKSIVAQTIAQQAGMLHIPADRIRNATYVHTDSVIRARLVRYIYKRLLLMHPTGLVIEGTVFLDRGVTLPLWAKERGFKVFAIGYALDDAGRKARSMIAYRRKNPCWTTGARTDAEIRQMARRIVARSRDIRTYCEANKLTYLDLDSGRFNVDLRRVTRAILRKMRVPVAR